MFKNLISPVQAWLLSQGKCVGCGMPLAKGKKDGKMVICKCKRVYVEESGKFRRAKMDEV
ncbi:hypothetical protein M1403_02290 [Patescibacteria group bacterium]|nr:hypothetical protein [Patescibacteria group bacterium]